MGSTLETKCFAKDCRHLQNIHLKESAIILLFVITFLSIINFLM